MIALARARVSAILVAMRLGLRTVLAGVIAGTAAGCLVTNPALTDTGEETDDTSTSGGASSGQSSEPTAGPTTDPTTSVTTGPTTTGPTTTDPDTTDTEDPTSDTETTGPAACGSGHICINEAPAGWSGPVVWAETPTAEEAPSCPAAYPEPAFSAFDDLQAPPAECDCECGAATGVNCATITLEYHHADSSCIGAPDDEFTILTNGNCNDGPASGAGRYWEVPQPGVTGGDCLPSGTSEVPAASWASASTVCGGPSQGEGTCDAGLRCLPEPPAGFESRVCVWQPGELDCPSGDYSDRFIRHGDYADTRNCATCTCGDPTGECTGTVFLRSLGDCAGTVGLSAAIGDGCDANVGNVESAEAGTLSVSNTSCEPSVGTAIGEAEPEDPYTLCCQAVQ